MKLPEQYKLQMVNKPMPNKSGGTFLVPNDKGKMLLVIAQQTRLWERVKITIEGRKPTWKELLKVMQIFWEEEEGEFTIFHKGNITGVWRSKTSTRKEVYFEPEHYFTLGFTSGIIESN